MPLDSGSPELNSGIPGRVYIIAKAWPGVAQDGSHHQRTFPTEDDIAITSPWYPNPHARPKPDIRGQVILQLSLRECGLFLIY
jgi:hypothetical protein